MNDTQLQELLYQALETEIGGQDVYRTAISCALNDDLREEWEKYLEETTRHEEILRNLFAELGLDPEQETPGRQVVRHIGESLVAAMELAKANAPAEAAELVAGECVVHAETKDHLNWSLMQFAAEKASKDTKAALTAAIEAVEDQEDEHLYHSKGWTRELWLQSLGLAAALPPPEERKHVVTAIGAERAANAREDYVKS